MESDLAALNDEVYEMYDIEEYQNKIKKYLDSFLTVIQ